MSANAKEFLVVNCLSQGFAVAGPVPEPDQRKEGIDLEMVVWGQSLERAKEMADDLNRGTKLEHITD